MDDNYFVVPRRARLPILAWMGLSECTFRLVAPNHLLAVPVQRVVDNPLRCVDRLIILEAKMPKALRDRAETRCLGLVPQRVVGVRTVDNLGKEHHGGITVEIVFLHYRVE